MTSGPALNFGLAYRWLLLPHKLCCDGMASKYPKLSLIYSLRFGHLSNLLVIEKAFRKNVIFIRKSIHGFKSIANYYCLIFGNEIERK